MNTQCVVLDLHLLDERFAEFRVAEPRAVERLACSIERDGQLVPCIAVADPPIEALTGGERLVLIDGYRRVAALRRLGRDTVQVEWWGCTIADAVLGVMARGQSRLLAPIEEALLIRKLTQGEGLSQREIARRSGHDVSWVSRRQQLLTGLPEAIVDAVIKGQLSTWAANRVLAPLARANSEHAERLMKALTGAALSTRELRQWFDRYQKSGHVVRERLVDNPQLYIASLAENIEQDLSDALRAGPEGSCETALQRVNGMIHSVRKRLPALRPLSQDLITVASDAHRNFEDLAKEIKRYVDRDGDPQQRACAQGAGLQPAGDQPVAQALA